MTHHFAALAFTKLTLPPAGAARLSLIVLLLYFAASLPSFLVLALRRFHWVWVLLPAVNLGLAAEAWLLLRGQPAYSPTGLLLSFIPVLFLSFQANRDAGGLRFPAVLCTVNTIAFSSLLCLAV